MSKHEAISRSDSGPALHDAAERLRALAESTLEAIITADREGIIIDWNNGAERTFGYSKKEAVGRTVEMIMPERYADAHRRGMERFRQTLEPVVIGRTIEIEGKRKDGSEIPVELSLSTYTARGERFFTAIIRDVSERCRADEAIRTSREQLRKREQQFRLLAENMTDLILLQDPEGNLVYVSPSSRRILGYDADELYGKNLYDLLENEDAVRLRAGVHEDMLEGKSYTEALVRARTKNGIAIWIELTGKPIVESDGTIKRLLTSARDVTERVHAEREAVRYRNELEQRNSELQDFAYVASHDLQEPLRKIRAFSDLLEEEYGDMLGEEGRSFLDRVRHAATRMSTLIDDLLTFSRVLTQGGAFEETDLNDVVEGVLADLEVAISESDAQIEVGDLPTLEADPMQMRQLFQNLIGNAIKFRKPEEAPRITIRSIGLSRSLRPAVGRRKMYRLEVSDNGMGFDAKYADRIFSPFQRLDHRAAVEGTGIGLAICRRIIERHDGRIKSESKPDSGATFTVELPVRRMAASGT